MNKHYSIAQAKNRFSHVIHEAEEDGPVELTRRGKTVAVVVSSEAYQRLQKQRQRRRDLWPAIMEWRKNSGGVELSDEEINSWRDRNPPREFDWPA